VLVGPLYPGIENHFLAALKASSEAEGFSVTLLGLSTLEDVSPLALQIEALGPRVCGKGI
jgi:hypothetical protein